MSAWKDLERRVCRALGGERRGPTGVTCSDCSADVPFAVEVKRSQRGVPEGRWIDQARAHGKAEAKPWLLVVSRPGSPRPVAVLDFWLFAELAQKAGLIGELAISPAPDRIERLEEATNAHGQVDADVHVLNIATTLDERGL